MESSISSFCEILANFCNHVQSSSQAITDSINRRPIPLDSAASTFLQSLERRVSAASGDLELLESMALGTVSFEELIGHCNEVYKINRKYASDIEDRLESHGYVPEIETDDEGEEFTVMDSQFTTPVVDGSKWNANMIDEDQLSEDSLSLKNLGLSDVTLATLASEDGGFSSTIPTSVKNSSFLGGISHVEKPAFQSFHNDSVPEIIGFDQMKTAAAAARATTLIEISKVDYDGLPTFMKNLVPWEDLQKAVGKINAHLDKNGGAISQGDLEALSLGPKARTYLLMLLRTNHMVVENSSGGSVVYRLRASCS